MDENKEIEELVNTWSFKNNGYGYGYSFYFIYTTTLFHKSKYKYGSGIKSLNIYIIQFVSIQIN